jgi:hypothetical protein
MGLKSRSRNQMRKVCLKSFLIHLHFFDPSGLTLTHGNLEKMKEMGGDFAGFGGHYDPGELPDAQQELQREEAFWEDCGGEREELRANPEGDRHIEGRYSDGCQCLGDLRPETCGTVKKNFFFFLDFLPFFFSFSFSFFLPPSPPHFLFSFCFAVVVVYS